MFRKVFAKLFSGKPAADPAPVAAPRPVPVAPAAAGAPPPPAPAATGTEVKPDAVRQWEEESARELDRSAKAEELCGLSAGMTQQQIRDHLAMLYRRHNRAASSLDKKLREEAEVMLNAIVVCRDKLLKD